jgi:hypothetical protein
MAVRLMPAALPGLDTVRAALEEHARSGPFAVDPDAALDALCVDWDGTATLGYDGQRYRAHLDGCEEAVAAATPDELVVAMRARWGAP